MTGTTRIGGEVCKTDDRPRCGGWAPGTYMNECIRCGHYFVGDKRAIECADCAYGELGVIAP